MAMPTWEHFPTDKQIKDMKERLKKRLPSIMNRPEEEMAFTPELEVLHAMAFLLAWNWNAAKEMLFPSEEEEQCLPPR